MKIALFFFLLLNGLQANTLHITQTYFNDINNTLTPQNALSYKELFKPITKHNLGVVKNRVWSHIQLFNPSPTSITKRIYNKRAGMDFIDVYLFNAQTSPFKTLLFGDQRDQSVREHLFRVAYFDITLKPQETANIFIKHQTYGAMEIDWSVADIDSFEEEFSMQSYLYALVFGMLVILILFSIIFYLHLRNPFYLIYPLFITTTTIYQLALAGYLYAFGLSPFLNTLSTFFLPSLALFLLAHFPISFFNLKGKKEYKYIVLLFQFFAGVMILFGLISTLYLLNPALLYVFQYMDIIAFIVMLLLIYISIKMYQKEASGALFYLLSNIVFLVFVSYFILGTIGLVPSDKLFYYSLSIGTLGQIIFIGLALADKTLQIREENQKSVELLHEYSKLTFIGQTFINIYHQWKTPLNNISNSINHLELAKEFEDKNLPQILDTNIVQIKNNITYIKETALNYLQYYSDSSQGKTHFNLYNEIESVLNFIAIELSKRSIETTIYCNKEITLMNHKSFFENLLMILFENAIEIFEARKIQNPSIKIDVHQNEDSIIISVEDNGGGITQEPIEKIFSKDVSDNSSTGIGLYLVKNLILEKLGGIIQVQNTPKGAKFTLVLPRD
jgi:signal transduction histidine kinase